MFDSDTLYMNGDEALKALARPSTWNHGAAKARGRRMSKSVPAWVIADAISTAGWSRAPSSRPKRPPPHSKGGAGKTGRSSRPLMRGGAEPT